MYPFQVFAWNILKRHVQHFLTTLLSPNFLSKLKTNEINGISDLDFNHCIVLYLRFSDARLMITDIVRRMRNISIL